MSSSIGVVAIGFLAQCFFSARILVQWILSEKARRVLSPTVFWVLSLMGSYLLFIYGWMRNDFAIILGQFVAYYIYLLNLRMKGVSQRLMMVTRVVLVCTPLLAVGFVAGHMDDFTLRFLHNDEVGPWLLAFGTIGQVLFTFRFIYQWLYSRRVKESKLPAGFWIISLVGALLILVYGFIRHDIVLIVGQGFGIVAYSRNLVLIANEKKEYKR